VDMASITENGLVDGPTLRALSLYNISGYRHTCPKDQWFVEPNKDVRFMLVVLVPMFFVLAVLAIWFAAVHVEKNEEEMPLMSKKTFHVDPQKEYTSPTELEIEWKPVGKPKEQEKEEVDKGGVEKQESTDQQQESESDIPPKKKKRDSITSSSYDTLEGEFEDEDEVEYYYEDEDEDENENQYTWEDLDENEGEGFEDEDEFEYTFEDEDENENGEDESDWVYEDGSSK